MNSKEIILEQLDAVKYIDFHIHMEESSSHLISDDVLYLANSINRESYDRAIALSTLKKNVIGNTGRTSSIRRHKKNYMIRTTNSPLRTTQMRSFTIKHSTQWCPLYREKIGIYATC